MQPGGNPEAQCLRVDFMHQPLIEGEVQSRKLELMYSF